MFTSNIGHFLFKHPTFNISLFSSHENWQSDDILVSFLYIFDKYIVNFLTIFLHFSCKPIIQKPVFSHTTREYRSLASKLKHSFKRLLRLSPVIFNFFLYNIHITLCFRNIIINCIHISLCNFHFTSFGSIQTLSDAFSYCFFIQCRTYTQIIR